MVGPGLTNPPGLCKPHGFPARCIKRSSGKVDRVATGTVKWFNNAKGYGFILSESGGEDLFVHYSSIQMPGYKTLRAGQQVEFDLQEGPKGSHAVNIRFAEEAGFDDDVLDLSAQ